MQQNKYDFSILALAVSATLLAGCASTARYPAMPSPRPLGAGYTAVEPAGGLAARRSVPDVLNLSEALALALQGSPELAAFSYEVRVAESRMLQAGLLPNPELELAVDEYDRDGAGFNSAEMAIVLGQVFELGGKRQWRKRIAESEGELAGWDYESKRLAIFSRTAQRFNDVLAAQERLELSRAAVALAEKTTRAVHDRVAAGKEPPLQGSRSKAELEMAHLDAQEAGTALAVARRKLAAMWGARQADFEGVTGDLGQVIQGVPSLEVLRLHLAKSPEMARWEAELRLQRAFLASEKAARIPDLEGAVGYVQYEEDSTHAIAFGVAIPLPVFDRNQGNIAAAAHGLDKVEAERAATEIALASELSETHAALSVAHQRVRVLRETVVPAMAQSFEAAHEGYGQGKFSFLDMLEAQRGLFEAQAALLDALSDYQTAVIDIQRLTATNIESLMNEDNEE
jgi:cobalt-zinc-cadmium efflux system outer membrane protein